MIDKMQKVNKKCSNFAYNKFLKISFRTHQHVSINITSLRYEVTIGNLQMGSIVQVTLLLHAVPWAPVVRDTVGFFVAVNFADITVRYCHTSNDKVF